MQSIPTGVLTIRPPPTEAVLATTDSTFGTKVAVTVRGASIVVWQDASAQSPPNVRKTDVVPGCGCSVTRAPDVKRAEHVPLTVPADSAQSMPPGVDMTRPLPVPLPETVRATVFVGSVMRVGTAFLSPEQAEIAAAATSADRTCRVRRRAERPVVA